MANKDEPPRPSLFTDRPLTPEERAARDEDPRPGVWAGQIGSNSVEHGDLRALTQDQTDRLIRLELLVGAGADRAKMERVVGQLPQPHGDDVLMVNQRGGIDSDPLVRLLAFRAWGDRDRRWFESQAARWDAPTACCSSVPPTITRSAVASSARSGGEPGGFSASRRVIQLLAEFSEKHKQLHRAWTAEVGTPGYVKALWRDRDNALVCEYRARLTALGYPVTAALLNTSIERA